MTTPWMHEKEINLIEKYITPETIMLEWGSGGSTIQFGKLAKQYFSIEHNKGWVNQILPQISKNTEIFYRPAKSQESPKCSSYENYQSYVDAGMDISLKHNIKFDVVLIDGRARVECAKHIIPYLSDNAVVLVHDFWKHTRARYQPILEFYNEIESEKSTLQTVIALRVKK